MCAEETRKVSLDFNGTCRCCFSQNVELLSLESRSGETSFADMLQIFATQPPAIELPNVICRECCQKLETAHNFYTKLADVYCRLDQLDHENNAAGSAQLPAIENSHRCEVCHLSFANSIEVFKHRRLIHYGVRQLECPDCNKLFSTRRGLRLHRNTHKLVDRSGWTCKFCARTFQKECNYATHMKRHEDKICRYCNIGFLDDDQMLRHITADHPIRSYKCCLCAKEFAIKSVLTKHMRLVHGNSTGLYGCGVCNIETKFTSVSSLTQHLSEACPGRIVKPGFPLSESLADEEPLTELLVESDINFTSELFSDVGESEFLFPDPSPAIVGDTGTKHRQFVHSVHCYPCPVCDEKFKRQLDMMVHLAHVHDDMSLVCNDCGARHNRVTEHEAHRREHILENVAIQATEINVTTDRASGELRFHCTLCDRRFMRRRNLDCHRCKFYTANGGQLPCNICAETFATTPELAAHYKTHLATDHFCMLCDKRFTTVGGLKYHLKTHTGVKSFTCPYCARKFTAKINLSAHIRSCHSGKPFACASCEQCFATADHLRKHHTAQHTGDRKFLCGKCGKQYLQHSHLQQHMWSHDGFKPFECGHCANAYSSQTGLRKHLMRIHSH